MAYFATPLSSVTAVSAATATKVPATAQGSRLMLKLYSDSPDECWWGGSTVTNLNGIPFNGESEWIPCSGDIWVWCQTACNVHALEGA